MDPGVQRTAGVSYSQVETTGDADNQAGTVTERGDYGDSTSGAPEPVTYQCQGPVALIGSSAQFTVEVGPYSPIPSIQTDFVGLMQAGGAAQSVTPSTCNTDPSRLYEPQYAQGFDESWFPAGTAGPTDVGDMLAVGLLIPQQDIGLQSFGRPPRRTTTT